MTPPGGGRGGFNKGPQLPWLLQQQVGGSGSQAKGHNRSFPAGRGRGRGGGSFKGSSRPVSRKNQRKAARQDKKHHKFEVQQQQAQWRHHHQQQQQQQQQQHQLQEQQQPAVGSKRPRQALQAALAAAAAPQKKQKSSQQQQQQQQQQHTTPAAAKQQHYVAKPINSSSRPTINSSSGGNLHSSKRTKFYDMLAADGVVTSTAAAAGSGAASQAAYLADLKLEREMAKKLKVKQGKASSTKDGLDALLSGITAGSPATPAAAAAAAADLDQGSSDLEGGNDDLGYNSDSDSDLGSSSEDAGDEDLGSSEDLDQGQQDSGLSSGAEEESEQSDQDSEPAEKQGSEEDHDGSDDGLDRRQQQQQQGAETDLYGRPTTAVAAAGGSSKQQAVSADAAGGSKYVPPQLRRQQQQQQPGGAAAGGDSDLSEAVQRRITGLLNRLAESNLQAICRDILSVYESEGRRAVSDAVSTGLLAAVAEGPRATEQFACIVAVFMAGMTALARAQDISARFLDSLVARLEKAYAHDDGLACHNLIMVLAYCYSTGLLAADCMYSVLGELTRRFTESDVAMMLTLLNAVGLQVRSADPIAMKDFVLAVHNRAAAAGPGSLTKRAEIMLELVVDIKNNKSREVKAAKAQAAAAAVAGERKSSGGGGRGGAAAVIQPGLLKWLKLSGVDEVTLVNISWAKLVQPDKKGMWWHPAATDAAAGLLPGLLAEHTHDTAAAAAAAADLQDGPGGDRGALSALELLQLAAGMRMTTDARRAVFVAIMGSEDCAEASEKLLRLPLKGDQSREIIRVLVECCLQEARYNPYYGHLAARLALVSKSHKITLQYCIWDQWKEIDFDACGTWTNKETFLWRHTMQQLLASFQSDTDSDAAFSRLAQQQTLGALCKSLGLFLKLRVGPWLVAQADARVLQQDVSDVCLRRLASAEKLLLSSAAAVLA